MASYAEGLNILHNADVGQAASPGRRRDRAAARRAVLPVRPRHPGGRRGVAARERRRQLAARPHRPRAVAEPRPLRLRGAGVRQRRGSLDHPRRGRRRRPRRRPRARRCSRASRRATAPTSPTGCSRRCARSSAATTRSSTRRSERPNESDRSVRRARVLRDVGRPRPQEDLPRALRDGEEGRARRPRHRRRVVAVDGRRPAPACPRQHHRVRRRRRRRGRVREAHRPAALRRRQLQRRSRRSRELKKELGDCKRPAHYLAIPPSMFEKVVEGLGSSGCAENARVIVEKPFGRDLESAQELNQVLHSVFPEKDIFRIDHYLGKEAIQNIIYFRFANSFLEPIWNRNYVRSGADHHGGGLRRAGPGQVLRGGRRAARRHREPPVPDRRRCSRWSRPSGPASRSCATARSGVFAAMETLKPDDLVRGQFEGYRDEEGVAPDSDVETFAAVRLHIDSWRWAGVPFYVRAGKNLPVTCTEVRVELHRPPTNVFSEYEQLPLRHQLLPLPAQPAHLRSRPVSGSRPRATASRATTSSCTSATTTPARRRPTSGSSATRSTARRCCSPAKTASSRRGGWSTTCSPTTAPRSRTPSTRGAREEQDRLIDDPDHWHDPVVDADGRLVTVEPRPHAERAAGRGPVLARGPGRRLRGARRPGGHRRRREARRRRDRGRDRPGPGQHRGPCLDDCGGSWADVARATIFLTDLGNFATVNALYEGAIGAHRPARTTIGVAAPARRRRRWRSSAGSYLPEETSMTRPASRRPTTSGGRS